jgi:hypothetical protein
MSSPIPIVGRRCRPQGVAPRPRPCETNLYVYRSERPHMPPDEFRIFLSAVTSEFGKTRDELAADLRSREALLRVQSDFRQDMARQSG